MKKWIIATYAIVFAVIGVSAYVYATNAHEPVEQAQVVVEQPKPPTAEELLTLVNAERAKVGAAPLTIDTKMNQSAQRKADEMVANNNTEHLGKDGVRGAEYANQTGIMCKNVSENLISNNDRSRMKTAREAVQGWMSSDRHREALLSPKYSTTGFGINSWAVVEHFCEK